MSEVRHYLIRPLDTWFLRDGQPFEQMDEGMAEVRSVFPPFPPMVVGAFRAAVARAMGWDGRSDWNGGITGILGDGPYCTGRLGFGPPVLLRRVGEEGLWEPLFPVPRHVLRDESGSPAWLLRPGDHSLRTDAGELPLPESGPGLKDCEGYWLDREDFARVLAGARPRRLVPARELWELEYRVGLQRDVETRTAVHGMLYAVHHVRLATGEPMPDRDDGGQPQPEKSRRRPEVALGLRVEVESDGAVPDPERLGPLGGFRRLAAFERLQRPWAMPREPAPPEDGRYVAVLLSPARFPELSWNRPEGEVPGLPGRIVFACTGRPVMIGGWDGRRGSRGPLPLRAHLPAGSVFFLEGDRAEVRELFDDAARRAIGEMTHLGFGHVLLGRWPRNATESDGS